MSTATTKPLESWNEEERAALRALSDAVYPERESANWPGRFLEWAPAEWGVAVRNDRGELVSYAGLLVRRGRHEGHPVEMGGVGGVKTHPLHRGAGHASAAMREAQRFFIEQSTVDFGLLVCDDSLIPYYGRLGWEPFHGEMFTEQPEGKVKFTFNRVMVLPVSGAAPGKGVIDLNGPPW